MAFCTQQGCLKYSPVVLALITLTFGVLSLVDEMLCWSSYSNENKDLCLLHIRDCSSPSPDGGTICITVGYDTSLASGLRCKMTGIFVFSIVVVGLFLTTVGMVFVCVGNTKCTKFMSTAGAFLGAAAFVGAAVLWVSACHLEFSEPVTISGAFFLICAAVLTAIVASVIRCVRLWTLRYPKSEEETKPLREDIDVAEDIENVKGYRTRRFGRDGASVNVRRHETASLNDEPLIQERSEKQEVEVEVEQEANRRRNIPALSRSPEAAAAAGGPRKEEVQAQHRKPSQDSAYSSTGDNKNTGLFEEEEKSGDKSAYGTHDVLVTVSSDGDDVDSDGHQDGGRVDENP